MQEVAFELSLVDSHAGAMVAAAEALTTWLPRTLGLMERGRLCGFGAMKVATATAWLSDAGELVDLCRRDHRLKDEPGWSYRLGSDGTLTVTTPTGHSFDSTPPPLHEPRPQGLLGEEPPPF
ncbi:hypothetical protein SD37_34390 [Amycolatopsis orientalis]|uniref:Uncharacterized protein n=1 Tax=Amycolatopsis orientalis TaxID=31958 RepID=A0A193C781_AMYOR|nr:hypothetical protein SD37_34390 [Amycolatopsis orientalis]